LRIEVVLNAGATIGESPTWASAEGMLYWIDVKKPALYRYDPVTGRQGSWDVSSDIGAFALLPHAVGAIVALREGVFRLEFASGSLTRLAPPPFDPTLFRFNEGACDGAGRFWIGVMFDPLDGRPPAQAASLHRFTLDEGLVPQPDVSELHNGMAWSPEEGLFYLSHSRAGEVFAYTFDTRRGQLGPCKLFAKVATSDGIPDGAAVDTEGGYWCALHGGSRLRRYTATGELDREITLPVSQPTMCAFGGEALDELYVTSASDKLSPEQRKSEPLAGALLRLRCGARGIPRACQVR
jgi:sugar lactone lactonase YvrE